MDKISLHHVLLNKPTPWSSAALAIVVLTTIYTIYGAIWRLFLSPVAHIPGPWFAKLTFWNEFYYDVICGGQYTWQIQKYHEIYGPVIRINPYEVHILDHTFIDEVYVGHGKRKSHKWLWAVKMSGRPDQTIFDTLDHVKHRARREPWSPYFSKASVSRAQPHIQAVVNKFCDRLAQHRSAGQPVTMAPAYSCLTIDVISEFTFPEGYNYLDKEDFDAKTHDAYVILAKLTHVFKQFGWLAPILLNMTPMALTKYLSPGICSVLQNEAALHRQAKEVLDRREHNISTQKLMTGRPSLIDGLLDSNLPQTEKTVQSLAGNALVAIGAGTLTTAHALKHATYHILANPRIHARLMSELEAAIPDASSDHLSLHQLESIEYLMAILYESLRNMKAPTQRSQRIFPEADLVYPRTACRIPAGTPISMTGCLYGDDPALFADPYTFSPERWLPLSTNGAKLMKHFMPFGRGTRNCVGMELGKAEVLTTLATVFRKFGRTMRLVDTTRERDVDIVADYFFALPSPENNGVVVAF